MEIWKDVIGYEGFYLVSNEGRIKSISRTTKHNYGGERKMKGRILGQVLNPRGYLRCTLCVNQKSTYHFVHRLIGEAFLCLRPTDKEINHINGIKADNRAENLEWVTKSENIKHAYRLGLLDAKGDNNGYRKWKLKQLKKCS